MIAIIVGMTEERVIGKDNALPWHIPEELKSFKELTNEQVVIMAGKHMIPYQVSSNLCQIDTILS